METGPPLETLSGQWLCRGRERYDGSESADRWLELS